MMYIMIFMPPCISWPEAFGADVGGDEHGNDRQDGEDQQGQVLCLEAPLGHLGQVDAKEVHVLAELGDLGQLLCGECSRKPWIRLPAPGR